MTEESFLETSKVEGSKRFLHCEGAALTIDGGDEWMRVGISEWGGAGVLQWGQNKIVHYL